MTIEEKKDWLENRYPAMLKGIDPQAKPLWGKMNVQQMVEHMSDYLRIANGKDPVNCVTPEEHLDKMRDFLMSEKPFKENTPNSLMSDTPAPHRWENIDDSIGELEQELNDFIDVFEQDKQKVITNPFFGDLNFEEQVQLLHKHATHHLRQFGVVA